jgi:hypothetical protein
MEVTEQERHGVHTLVRRADLATKHDLRELEHRVEALEARLDARFDAQDARFDANLEALRSSTLRSVGTWLFASQAAVITAIGLATGVIVALT